MHGENKKVIVFCIVIFLFIFGNILVMRFSLVVAMVISQSMSPTLEIGDRVLAFRYWPARWLRKGQIVLFRPPAGYQIPQYEPYSVIPLIKRVVGLPGDTLIDTCISPSLSMNDNFQNEGLAIPPGHFGVRGDLETAGSALLTLGPIPFDNLLALVVMKLPRRDHENERRGLTSADADETRLV